MKVGILAVQGDFEAHARTLEKLGAGPVYVRSVSHLEGLDALILPGGESTTMLKFLQEEGLWDAILAFAASHPLLGTCAGAILMASEVTRPAQPGLGLLDVTIERNAYGRQVDSHISGIEVSEAFAARAGSVPVEGVFIRAPIIRRAGCGVQTLLEHRGHPVLVEQGRHLAATFHPELTADTRIHQLLLDKVSRA